MEKVANFLWGEEAFDGVTAKVGQRRVVEVGFDQRALCQKYLLNGSKKAYLLGVVIVGLNVLLETTLHHLRVIGDGIEGEQVREATGWELAVSDRLRVTSPPTDRELSALRELLSR